MSIAVLSLCASCTSPYADEIDRRLLAGEPDLGISRWLRDHDAYISRQAIGKHKREHLRGEVVQAKYDAVEAGQRRHAAAERKVAADFAQLVRDRAAERLAAGEIAPSVNEGLNAQALLDKRAEKANDRDLMRQLAYALSGAWVPEVIEGEYREEPPLLEAGP